MNEEEVKERLWDNFITWMSGQTVGLNKDGSIDYYDDDVKRYLR